MHEKLTALIERLYSLRLAREGELRGCTQGEIASFAESISVSLPTYYVEFLETMGRSAGRYLRGSSVFFPELLKLRDWARELLAESGSAFALGKDDVVFYMHQGYQFAFFSAIESDDPDVWYFYENWDSPKNLGKSLSSFLLGMAEEAGKIVSRYDLKD